MVSHCGRYAVVFNGEIYNHHALRQELEQLGVAPAWRGHSDTEALLASVNHWGFDGALERFNGMFAIALWDKQERTLFLARDRMGEKPLYYGWQNGVLLFGSELKALRSHPVWQGEIDRDALASFLRFSYVPAPHSIYKGIYKLPPAHYLALRSPEYVTAIPQAYWSIRQVALEGTANSFSENATFLVDELDVRLQKAVAIRMESDVPLGAFLSGGYDSSTIVAMMQAKSSRPVRTFSIGFQESDFDEAPHARAVAEHLGTDHTELYVTPSDALNVIPKLPDIWDEPFSDSSQIPTYLLSALTRRSVTVSLSGDGGDELFGGYERYHKALEIWRKLSLIPGWIRRLSSSMVDHLAVPISNRFSSLPGLQAMSNFLVRAERLSGLVRSASTEELYLHMVSHWKSPAEMVIGAKRDLLLEGQIAHWRELSGFAHQMMYLDMCTYLPDDILAKVDRASMAVSLEARVPLLDHEVVEFAWQVPLAAKIRNGNGKWILREVAHRYVPKVIMERPKMGFGVPIEQWLRGPLREWGESLLDEQRLKREGYFDPGPVRKMWQEHQQGQGLWHYCLWDILMFQAWLERWR